MVLVCNLDTTLIIMFQKDRNSAGWTKRLTEQLFYHLKQFKYFQQNIATSLYIIIVQSVVDVSLHNTDVYRVKNSFLLYQESV